jgi:uncharacterized protein (DUF1684 family)
MHRYLFCIGLILLAGCQAPPLPVPDDYEAQWHNWHQQRLNELTAPRGWLSLIGLYWLEDGANTFGSRPGHPILLPSPVPAEAGAFYLQDTSVRTVLLVGDSLRVNADTTEFGYGAVEWLLLNRGGRWGVRVRDTLQPTRIQLAPIDHYPIDPAYRVRGYFTPAQVRSSRRMRNVLGMEYEVPVVGTLDFRLRGKQESLLALDGGPDELFLIFSDVTTGATTYGGGRYLYCPQPDENGETIIDFNRAYNPPCAFTEYATCLLPLAENHLELALEAGEKTYGSH